MTEQKKTTAKAASGANATKTQNRSAILGVLSKRAQEYNARQIDFAQESTNEYFDTLRAMADADSLPAAFAVYNRFAMDSVARVADHARALGEVVTESRDEIGSELRKLGKSLGERVNITPQA